MSLLIDILDIDGSRLARRSSRLFSMPSDIAPHGGEHARVLVRRCFVGMTSIGEVTSRGHDIRVTEPAGATLIIPRRGRILSVGPDGAPRAASPGGAIFLSPNRRNTRVAPDENTAFVASR